MTTDQNNAAGQGLRASWDRTVRRDDGVFHLPLTLEPAGRSDTGILDLTHDEAALLHAQLERLLNDGWAMTELTRRARACGEVHPPYEENPMAEPEILKPWFNASSNDGSSCVDVQLLVNGGAQVRNSKNPDAAILDYNEDEWLAFTRGVKAGVFDHPAV